MFSAARISYCTTWSGTTSKEECNLRCDATASVQLIGSETLKLRHIRLSETYAGSHTAAAHNNSAKFEMRMI